MGRPARQAPGGDPPVQLTREAVLAVWAAAALPMAAISWVVAPLAARAGGPDALVRALLVGLTAGLIWQSVLVVGLLARERRRPDWPGWRPALWLHAPRPPNPDASQAHRAGVVPAGDRRSWWVLAPMLVGFAAESAVPTLPVPAGRDLAAFLGSARGEEFFQGAWGWFGVVVLLTVFNTVLGEELLFRGYLLPRMPEAFGHRDWVANGVLFAAYHLHTPWVIPTALLDTAILSYPCRRYRSALLGILVHSSQSIFFLAIILRLVL